MHSTTFLTLALALAGIQVQAIPVAEPAALAERQTPFSLATIDFYPTNSCPTPPGPDFRNFTVTAEDTCVQVPAGVNTQGAKVTSLLNLCQLTFYNTANCSPRGNFILVNDRGTGAPVGGCVGFGGGVPARAVEVTCSGS